MVINALSKHLGSHADFKCATALNREPARHLKMCRCYLPQRAQTASATAVATTNETMKTGNVRVPVIAMLVKVAKSPPAGVNAPYMKD